MMGNLHNNVGQNIKEIKKRIEEASLKADRNPQEIMLMAVTKTVPANIVNMAIDTGITLLGENRVQELESKYLEYNKSAVIHFIGHLQSNKVKYVVNKVSMIHSVDRVSLLSEIDKQAKLANKVIDILVQVNIEKEDTKSGVYPENLSSFVRGIEKYSNVRLRGLMAIPPVCNTLEQQELYFLKMQTLLVDIQVKNRDNSSIDILSTGMSGDFESAIKYGATIVRVGTAIFGNRN